MERGLYAAATGMIAQQTIQDTLAQNIANAGTVGYKQDNPTFRAMHGMALRRLNDGAGRGPNIGELGLGVQPDKVYTDWQTGPISQTNKPLDASLPTDQFFVVSTPRGERYTKAGAFQLDKTGNLMTAGGLPVVGADNLPIRVTGPSTPALDGNGNLVVDGKTVAQLKIVQADTNLLTKEGETLFAPAAPTAVRLAAKPALRPGTLEQSNVNAVSGMVQMITISRAFEMAQRAIVTQDEMLRHAANEVGKV
jgi:flagellar basal-body rod protein FlgF